MAEATAEATEKPTRNRPSRARAAAAPKPAEVPANREVLDLTHVGNTKTYSKWQAPEGSGCAGNFYAPLGVTAVKVAYAKP